jgi:hypothetical protein
MMDTHDIGKGFDWVICDFGFATFTSDSKVQLVAGLKRPNTKGITIRYAAPEVSKIESKTDSSFILIYCIYL